MTTEVNAINKYKLRNNLEIFSPSAALIDMDGTLYDSMPNHATAWHQLMSEISIESTVDEFFLYEGMTGAATINLLFNRAYGHDALPEEAEKLYKRKTEIFAALKPVKVMQGAQEMVNRIREAGLNTVLVTGSGQNTLLKRLDTDYPLAFPENRRITSRDVTHGKPDPEPFLKAMAKIGSKPVDSIAVDNAPIGVKSGSASGAFTIGVVTGPVPAQALYDAGADIVYPSMEEMAERLPLLIDNFK